MHTLVVHAARTCHLGGQTIFLSLFSSSKIVDDVRAHAFIARDYLSADAGVASPRIRQAPVSTLAAHVTRLKPGCANDAIAASVLPELRPGSARTLDANGLPVDRVVLTTKASRIASSAPRICYL